MPHRICLGQHTARSPPTTRTSFHCPPSPACDKARIHNGSHRRSDSSEWLRNQCETNPSSYFGASKTKYFYEKTMALNDQMSSITCLKIVIWILQKLKICFITFQRLREPNSSFPTKLSNEKWTCWHYFFVSFRKLFEAFFYVQDTVNLYVFRKKQVTLVTVDVLLVFLIWWKKQF